VQGLKISVTKRSINLIKEYRNYLWRTDKDGKILNVPEDIFNHLMDALRYGFSSYRLKKDVKFIKQSPNPILRMLGKDFISKENETSYE